MLYVSDETNIQLDTINDPQTPQTPPLPPLPPIEFSTFLQSHPNIENSNGVDFESVPPTIIQDLPQEKTQSKWHKYTHFPTFTIIVTIVDVALFIWTLCINGFASPSLNPMLGTGFAHTPSSLCDAYNIVSAAQHESSCSKKTKVFQLGPPSSSLLQAGAKWTPYIKSGEWWRLISASYLHAGFIHIIMNLLTQIVLGVMLEKKYGTIRFTIIYVLSGVGGMLTSAIFIPTLLTVGSSGALFGIIAMWCIDIFQNVKKIRHPLIAIISIISTVLISLALGLLPYVDNFAHIGGFIFGLELSFVFVLKFEWDRLWKKRLRYILLVAFACLYILNTVGFFILLFQFDVNNFCPNCHYVSCIPMIQNGKDWCDL